jgi:5-methylcytosine-specific restriction endonuclease McrA
MIEKQTNSENKNSSDRVDRSSRYLLNKHQRVMKTQVKNHHNPEYGELLQRSEWSQKREVVLKRDGHRCLNCGSENNLQVHHRQYHRHVRTGSYKKPWDYKDQYLITLCFDCHKVGHKYYKVPIFNV